MSLSFYSSSVTNPISNISLAWNVPSLPNEPIIDYRFPEIFFQFEQNVQIIANRDKVSIPKKEIKNLSKVMELIREDDPAARLALRKEEGYLKRFFSNESWDEWTEDRTQLGQVASLFREGLTKPLPKGLLRRFNANIILRAIEQSKKVLFDCKTSLALGAVGSFATTSPIPLAWASFSCIDQVNAQKQRSATLQRAANQRRSTISSHSSKYIYDRELEDKVLEEVGERLPKSLKLFFREANSWVDYLFNGVEFILDVTSVTAPVNDLKWRLDEMNKQYWINTVQPEYLKIFNPVQQAWDNSGKFDHNYEINIMRGRLLGYGYKYEQHGTPVQFIHLLQKQGVSRK